MLFLCRATVTRAAGLAAVAALALTVGVHPVAAAPVAAAAAPAVTSAPKTTAPVTTTPRVALPAGVPTGLPGDRGGKAAAGNDLTFGLERGEMLVRRGTSTTVPNTIVSFDLPPAGSTGPQGGYGTYLVLQSDGNLVEYETTTGKVLFVAGNKAGVKFVYQTDGNAVLYDSAGKALFNTRTAGDTVGQFLLAYGNGQLLVQSDAGRVVAAFGQAVTALPGVVTRFANSPNGRYQLVVQSDGNIVASDVRQGRAIWSTGTGGHGKVRFAVQSDGNLVVYAYPSNTVLWQTRTARSGSAYYQLDMKNNGNVGLYKTNGRFRTGLVWQSGSTQG